MTIADILLLDYDTEVSNTRRTIERVPEDQPDYAPHAKSMKLGNLTMHCATILNFGYYIIEDDAMDMANSTRPHMDLNFTTIANALQQLDEIAAKTRVAIASSTDEHLEKLWKFSFGEHLISHTSRALSYRQMCFDHLIHHTAQLGVYLRMLDIPVPALYGPSADEQWSPK